MFPVLLHPAVQRRLRRRVPPRMLKALESAYDQLAHDPFGPRPDRAAVWRRAFATLPNHRHLDLPMGWRLGYAVVSHPAMGSQVAIVFVGTHKEYERTYGFEPS